MSKHVPEEWKRIVSSIHSGNECRLLDTPNIAGGISVHGHHIPGSDYWNDVERGNFLHAMRCFQDEIGGT